MCGDRTDMLHFMITLIAESEQELIEVLEEMEITLLSEYNMRINKTKIKTLVESRNGFHGEVTIQERRLEVGEFRYLKSKMTLDRRNKSKREVLSRINQAKLTSIRKRSF